MNHIRAPKDPAVSAREREHTALVRRLAGQCAVLLENDGTLPLAGPGRIALFGNGARQTVRGGTGSGDVNVRQAVNIAQGLENAGFEVVTGPWLDRQDAHHAQAKADYAAWVPAYAKEKDMSEFLVVFSYPFQIPAPVAIAPEDMRQADAAVYVISRTSGEGADRFARRGDYLLYDEEREQLTALGAAYEKLIVVLNVGGVMDLSELHTIPGVSAVLLLGQLGSVGGDALADLLLGKTDPSGRLTDTWAKRYADYPAAATFSHNDGDVNDEYYAEGVFVGYRYFDSFGVEPLYPFGYGLSYTSFSLSAGTVTADGGTVAVPVTVRNTGARPGREVVQLYVSAPAGSLPKPYQALTAFQKTGLLAPSGSETVCLRFSMADLASYSEDKAAWILEAGEYVLRVGASSRNTAAVAALVLPETVVTAQAKNLFAGAGDLTELTPPAAGRPIDPALPRVAIDPRSIPTGTFSYQGPRKPYAAPGAGTLTAADVKAGRCTVEELTAQLTVEEMATLCVGTLRFDSSIVGNASQTVPGAAGDTSPILLQSRGVKPIVMADGPAGLRLQPVFKADKAGNILPGGKVMGDMILPFDPQYDETNSDTYYQYCTAIPIGWSLAMSWDPAMLVEAGSVVGEEMELFGVDLWLAPALNIHRDPLCGRNFEYYSEDPLVAGLAAAAITRGVQRHPGKGVTIKHFAANSQEDNRYFTNSHISERAIREIYLRGFEIAVRQAQPLAVMTSYNLLNGIHTANHYDLLQAVCRDEWGYRGVVMTDWFTSQRMPNLTGKAEPPYPISASTGCVYAGNDIQMPGCQGNVDDIVRAVTTGESIDGYRLTLADLQFCAANVIRAAIAMDAGEAETA